MKSFELQLQFCDFCFFRKSSHHPTDHSEVAGRRAGVDRGRAQKRTLADGVRVQGDVRGALLRQGLRGPVPAEGRQFRSLQLQPRGRASLSLRLEGRLLQHP